MLTRGRTQLKYRPGPWQCRNKCRKLALPRIASPDHVPPSKERVEVKCARAVSDWAHSTLKVGLSHVGNTSPTIIIGGAVRD